MRNEIITYQNKEYQLQQDAYISDDATTYQALATDSDGKDVIVFWEIVCHSDDESNCCNWDVISRIDQ